MKMHSLLLLMAIVALVAVAGQPRDQGDGLVPMWNGKDLSGWVNVHCAPETFFVKEDMIVTTGKPTGYLRTAKQYENFIAEFDWMHVPPTPTDVGNSGFFVWCDPLPAVGTGYSRGIEVQVLVNLEKKDYYTSQGDLFSIWGATCVPDRPHPHGWERCLPSENRTKGANEWNHYRVIGNDGVLKLEVNGKEVSGVSKCSPRKGYLALESEGSECRFKNLKIKELPSTNPAPKDVADVAKDFKQMYTGLDLRGWKTDDEHKKHWKVNDWNISYDGKCQAADPNLWTEKEYGDCELIVDWRLTAKPQKVQRPVILPNGLMDKSVGLDVQDAGASGVYLRGKGEGLVQIWCWPVGSGLIGDFAPDKDLPREVRPASMPKEKADKKLGDWNRFRIRVQGDRVTVFLNSKLVVDQAQVPGLAQRGPIGLVSRGNPVQYGNLFIRELAKDE